jgi:hypothetical protein
MTFGPAEKHNRIDPTLRALATRCVRRTGRWRGEPAAGEGAPWRAGGREALVFLTLGVVTVLADV